MPGRSEITTAVKRTYGLFSAALRTGNPSDKALALDVGSKVIMQVVRQFPSLFSPEQIKDVANHFKRMDLTTSDVYGTFMFTWEFLRLVLREMRKEVLPRT
jgi:hypothetical protein